MISAEGATSWRNTMQGKKVDKREKAATPNKAPAGSVQEEGRAGRKKHEGAVEIIPRHSVYLRRQLPPVVDDGKTLTPELVEEIARLDGRLKSIAARVMAATAGEKSDFESYLKEIRDNLSRIIKIDPARYETPLGDELENAIVKIYTMLGR